jgi:hypothetical protein
MIRSVSSLFLLAALVATSSGWAGCAASSDDDDDDVADGDADSDADADSDVCNDLTCNDEGEACCEGIASCITTTTNFQHCGGCGQACLPTEATQCLDGECSCGQSGEACAGDAASMCCSAADGAACVDTRSNPEACGSCNNNCIAPTVEDESDRCTDGACACGDGGAVCAGGPNDTCCPDPEGGASCHDILGDYDNCGGCALADRSDVLPHVRGDGTPDSHFACSPEVSNLCHSIDGCVCGIPKDPFDDPFPCLGGRASTCCEADPLDPDLAICADLDTSELHCGECNNPCAKNETCVGGVCT